MRRSGWVAGWTMLAGGLIWLAAQAPAPGAAPLASFFPPGASLYLEARDFGRLLQDWKQSDEKRLWLASDNYAVFSRSNLFAKLQRAQQEFAAAAGVPPDMALVSNAAGGPAGLALYDIGKLQFLYITRSSASRWADSALWKARGNYEPRKAAGLDYFVRFDKASDRVAAFASFQDYLLLATREDALAGALTLLAGGKGPSLAGEPWFGRLVQAASAPGELRLALNLGLLLQSPYMRSYWVQRNASELRQYSAAISDVNRDAGEIREDRILLRNTPEAPAWNEDAVAQATPLAPSEAGLYQAWASPTNEQAFALAREKILNPQPGSGPESVRAPDLESMDAETGTEADLEVRIDEPPLEKSVTTAGNGFAKVGKLDAMMYVASTRLLPDGAFVGVDSAVVMLGDAAGARAALAAAGLRLDGASPMAVSVNGRVLVVGNRAELVEAILKNVGRTGGPGAARYAATYRNSLEFPRFRRLMKLLDNPLKQDGPMFFSQNVVGLGSSLLNRLEAASILVHDTGDRVTQKLVYKTKP